MESANSNPAPLVSVIIPLYNKEAYLTETLKALYEVEYPDLEVVIVDDGSRDGSLSLARKLSEADRRLRVLHQENQGVCVARNHAIREARGKYVLPLDADDILLPGFLEWAVAELERDPELKVVVPRAEFFGAKTGPWRLAPYSPQLLARRNMIPATALYRRSDWERVRGYNEQMQAREDWEFWIHMLKDGGRVETSPELGLRYRILPNSKRKADRRQKHQIIDTLNALHPEFFKRYLGGPLRYHRSWSRLINFFDPSPSGAAPLAPRLLPLTSHPLVSIIVPVYNMQDFLAETLRSILATEYPEFEVLVIDDGSRDKSLSIAQEVAREDARLRVIHQENQGASAARNNGISQARGKYILPVDADNLIEPTYVGAAVQVMESEPEVLVVAPRTDQFGLLTGEIHFPPFSLHQLAQKNMIDNCAMFRRSEWERLGGYCRQLPTREDWEFWIHMLKDGGRMVRLPNIEFHYRQHAAGKSRIQSGKARQVRNLICQRHPELYEREFGGPLRRDRHWTTLLNRLHRLLHPRRTVVAVEAPSQLLYFVRSLPVHFDANHGEVIHRGRNELRRLAYRDRWYVVKQFARPNPLNRLVYGTLRKSKAQRSYENAQLLLRLGIGTPKPVAWQTERNLLLLDHSYYVSQPSTCPYTYADLIVGRLPQAQADAAFVAIGELTAHLHQSGLLHRDYSRGNILLQPRADGSVYVELVDLNRLRHRRVDMKLGCQNFAERLPATERQRRLMAEAYARVRGFDPDECLRLMLQYNKEKE